MIISRSRFPFALGALGMALAGLVALAISIGSFPVPVANVIAVLWAALTSGDAGVADNVRAVVPASARAARRGRTGGGRRARRRGRRVE